MNTQDSDGEADSLFGSPPPSPPPEFTRGGSPALALPGSSCAPCATFSELPKNVGTIALPGSHAHSELVVSLLESLPSSELVRLVQPLRPAQPAHRAQSTQPAQPGSHQYRFAEWIGPRATSLPVGNPMRSKHRRKTKAKSATPELGSNDHVSPHFLSSLRDLHGLASAMGGLNTANSSFHDSRGTTKDDPIVVDEETPSAIASPRDTSQPQGPSNRSLPSSQAIADALISQGNVFPVLRSFMPYFGLNTNVGCCSGRTLQQYRFHDQLKSNPNITAPPLKRRKLSSVPAGAKDWDVPYPFPTNEGPPNYLESWQKKRGKKLMMQLVSLVREAVQKASVKSQTQVPQPNMSRLAEIDSLQPDMPAVTEKVADNVVVPVASEVLSTSAPSHLEQQTMSSNTFASSGVMDSTLHFDSSLDSFLNAVDDALSNPNVELTGHDLATMSSYPFSPSDSTSPTLTDSTRFPTPADSIGRLATESKETDVFQTQDFNFDDLPIDPSLLEFPWPGFSTSGMQHSETGLSIPATLESVPRTGSGQQTASNTTPLNETPENVPLEPVDIPAIDPPTIFTPPTDDLHVHAPPASTNEPIASDISDATPSRPVATQSRTTCQQGESSPMLPMVDENKIHEHGDGSGPSFKKLDRRDVLRRARVRREQLAAEVARAKIELWETTIEQGVLMHLSKDEELHPTT